MHSIRLSTVDTGLPLLKINLLGECQFVVRQEVHAVKQPKKMQKSGLVQPFCTPTPPPPDYPSCDDEKV